MLDEGTVHLGGELQKSLQILDQAVDISGYVNSNHVWTGRGELLRVSKQDMTWLNFTILAFRMDGGFQI